MALATAAAVAITGASPIPFAPNGPSGAGTSPISSSIGGTPPAARVAGPRNRRGSKGAGARLPELVGGDFLEGRPAEAVRRPAEELPLDERRVQDTADVLRD